MEAYGGVWRCFLKKNQATPRLSEHPSVMGEKMSKRLGGIKRLQIQNLFMAFKQVPRCRYHWVHSIMSGRNPPLYCTFTLIAMQGHQKNIRSKPETMEYTITHGSSNIHYKGCKYKATTWYLTGFPTGSNLGSTV